MILLKGKNYLLFRKKKYFFFKSFFSILLPAILNQSPNAPTSSSSVVETNAIPLEQLTETSNPPVKEMTEDELIKEIQAGSQARYV